MIWVILWASGVLAGLYFAFGKRLLWVFLYFVGLIALVVLIIAGGLIQEALVHGGYGRVLEAVSQIGWRILIGAIVVFVADMSAMAIYTIRHGDSGGKAHRIVTEKRAMAMSPGLNPPTGFSKRKIRGSKHGFVTMKSLVDGTAAPAERAMVLGIFTAMGSFFLIFVGLALIGAKTNPVLLGVMVIPTLWLWNIVKDAWRAYQRVKAGLPEDEEDVQ